MWPTWTRAAAAGALVPHSAPSGATLLRSPTAPDALDRESTFVTAGLRTVGEAVLAAAFAEAAPPDAAAYDTSVSKNPQSVRHLSQ